MMPTFETLETSCFCDPWRNSRSIASNRNALGAYTDADLAGDMNSLSFAERQAVEEDIHGVSDVIKETPDFVTEKIEEMKQALAKVNSQQRQAWDRAVFLRPAFAEDVRFHHFIFITSTSIPT